jgi:UDP-N-acetylglucosamine--N-acetylmuramyl-(pentapeptide) pyrophosphoryl-undecaprenol N-acetylglucosamine transferase
MPKPKTLRVVVSGGGTGGHIYPALAVANALLAPNGETKDGGAAEVLYLHGPGRIDEEVLAYAGLPHRRLDVGAIKGTAFHRVPARLLRLARGTVQASAAMHTFGAHVVLATGGYVSAPAVIAAALRRIPVVLYLPDASPGIAIRAFAPFAKRIALSFSLTKRYFTSKKAVVTGYPVRPEFLVASRAAGRKAFDFSDDLPVMMVMGGSSGARSINSAVSEALEPLLHHAQVIHLCGDLDEQRLRTQRAQLDPAIRPRYHLFRYLHRGIADAMAACDLIVCRSGASVLAELPIVKLPAVLIPHPYGHQDDNADFLVEHGGAVKVPDAELAQGALLSAVLPLLADAEQRAVMAAEMARLARPEAANNIAALVRSVARR